MNINRTELLSSINQFAIGGNGLVFGKPGVGKSTVMSELKRLLNDQSVLSFIIKIDNAFDSSDEAIQAELGLNSNWIDKFKSIKITDGKKAVLIFDAFDAARDEEKRQGFLKQIKKALKLLSDKWNIIVCARTYDAQKSQELQRLFPLSNLNSNYKLGRSFEVPELSEAEISQLQELSPALFDFYQSSNDDLQHILKVPFFMSMLEFILNNTGTNNVDNIKTFRSEVQLLDEYWRIKIVATEGNVLKENFLSELTAKLVSKKILNISISDFPNLDNSEFTYLRSENILDEVGLNGLNIAFSHNIIFDYAVSRYCLSSSHEGLSRFISEDKSRPFFFRPSFIYFFTSLWYKEPSNFWKLYSAFSKDDRKEIQLFIRLIISTIIASEISGVAEIDPILDNPDQTRAEQIRNLLQSMRFVRDHSTIAELSLLVELSKNLDILFLFEFGFLLERSSKSLPQFLTEQGVAARNFMSFILDKRAGSRSKEFLDRIGAARAVGLVSKTYASNIDASRHLLTRVLNMIQEPGFEIDYFSNLTEEVKNILPHDPLFAEQIYSVIFGHDERSTEKTSMGGGVLFNFIGNRRQDFELCQYRLQQIFTDFLIQSPEIAIRVGVKIVDQYSLNKRGKISKNTISNFDFEGRKYTIIKDFSYFWSESRMYVDKPLELAYDIYNYWSSLISEDKIPETISCIYIYMKYINTGFSWKILFEFLSKHSKFFADKFWRLAITPELLNTVEVSYDLKYYLSNTFPLLTEKDRKVVEQAIFDVFDNQKEQDKLHEFLSILPNQDLALAKSREFMSGKGVVPNTPPVQYSSSVKTYTTEEWLKDKGVDTKDSFIHELLGKIEVLEKFNHKHANSNAPKEDMDEVFGLIGQILEVLKGSSLDENLFYSSANAIAQAATIIIKTEHNFDSAQILLLKTTIIDCFKARTASDDSNANNSPASGYSPTPRTNAAEGLVPLYLWFKENEIEELIKEAANDVSGPIRFHVLVHTPKLFKDHYELYRDIIYERFKLEQDDFIYGYLISLIHFKKETIQEDVAEIVTQTNKRVFGKSRNRQLLEPYAQFLLYFLDSDQIYPSVVETLEKAYNSPELCNTIVFDLFKNLSMPIDADGAVMDGIHRKVDIISLYVKQAGNVLHAKSKEHPDFQDEEIKNAIKLIDQVVMRIFFCLEPRRSSSLEGNRRSKQWSRQFYKLIAPIYQDIIKLSGQVTPGGFMLAGTAHYFIQSLNIFLPIDPVGILNMASDVTKYSSKAGYTLDSMSIREIVKFTETLLADHREVLLNDNSFSQLLDILDIYVNSGWVDALNLLWRLDEVFK